MLVWAAAKTSLLWLPEEPLDEYSGCPNTVAKEETPCLSRHGKKPGAARRQVMTKAVRGEHLAWIQKQADSMQHGDAVPQAPRQHMAALTA